MACYTWSNGCCGATRLVNQPPSPRPVGRANGRAWLAQCAPCSTTTSPTPLPYRWAPAPGPAHFMTGYRPPAPPPPPHEYESDSSDGTSLYGSTEDLIGLCNANSESDDADEEKSEAEGPNTIDVKAEEFIANFYQQMRLQLMNSIKN